MTIIVSVSSVVVEVASALAFKFHGDTNDRLDRLGREAFIVEQTRLSMQYILEISDTKARDDAIADLVRRLQASAPDKDTNSNPHEGNLYS
jgi:hypothetical protein